MDALDYIRRNAEVSVGAKRIHTLYGIERSVTFSVTLFAPFDSYRGDESTWEAARVDELLQGLSLDEQQA